MRARAIAGKLSVPLIALTLVACGADDEILQGERIPIRPTVEVSADPDRLPPVRLSKAITNTSWTHENGNARHHAGHLEGSFPLEPIWSVSAGRGASREGRITSGPIVADGRIYTIDAAAHVSAFGLDGQRVWSRDLTLKGETRQSGFGGGVAYGNDTLVATTGFGEVIAMAPGTGEVLWRQELDAPVRAAPTVSGGVAYVVSRNDHAFAIDLKNGRIKWRIAGIEPSAGVVGGASPAIAGPLVVLPFASGEVVAALARNGRRAWTSVLAGGRRGLVRARLSDITGDPVVSGNTVYVANQSGRLVAVDRRSGDRLWSVNEGSLGPSLPIGGSLFFVTDEAKLKRLDARDGSELWSIDLPQYEDPEKRRSAFLHTSPVMMGGRLLVASGDGLLRSFDPTTGDELSATALGGGGAAAQPAITNGHLYILARDGTLFAFK